MKIISGLINVGNGVRPQRSLLCLSWRNLALTMTIAFCFFEAPKFGKWLGHSQDYYAEIDESYSSGFEQPPQEIFDMDRDFLASSETDMNVANFKLEDFKTSSVQDTEEIPKNDFSLLSTWIKFRQNVYVDRQKRVEKICRQFNVSMVNSKNTFNETYTKMTDKYKDHYLEDVNREHFLLSRSYQLMGCFINKVASSSLVKTFLTLEGIRVDKVSSPHAYKPRLVPESEKEFQFSRDHFYKMVFVRHPMERLVSCYYDKMLTNTHKSLRAFRRAVKYRAQKIMVHSKGKNRRKRSSGNVDTVNSTTKASPGPGFELSLPYNESRLYNESQDNFDGKTAIPTFEEFLEYILSTDLQGEGFSSHWVPYWRQCTPCHFQYDMIGKLETGFDDFTYLWKVSGIDRKAPLPFEHSGVTTDLTKMDEHKQKMKSFYETVPRELLLRVYNAYKLDFELFQYDINEVLTLAGYEPMTSDEE